MTNRSHSHSHERAGHPGLLLRSAQAYDWLVWLLTVGREQRFREIMLRPAGLREGEHVLDVGCGTGSLALVAKRQVGPNGRVAGIDGSPEMIDRARRKATKAKADISFEVAPAQALPFDDGSFDVVLSTLMLHHLPRPSREQLGREIRRVLKPGGRVLAVDFARSNKKPRGIINWIHARHGATSPADMAAPLTDAGLEIIRSGLVGAMELHFALGRAPGASAAVDHGVERSVAAPSLPHAARFHAALPVIALVALVAVHLGAAAWIAQRLSITPSNLGVGALAGIVGGVLLKATLFARWRKQRRAD